MEEASKMGCVTSGIGDGKKVFDFKSSEFLELKKLQKELAE